MNIIEKLLIIRQAVIRFYKKYDYVASPLLKLVSIYMILSILTKTVGYQGALNNPVFLLLFSIIGAVLPEKGMLLAGVVIVPLCAIKLNPILGGILFIFLAVLYLLFMRVFPKESLWIVVMIAACCIKIEILIPFVAALLGNYVCGIAMLIGVFIWYAVPNLAEVLSIGGTNKEALTQMLNNIMSMDTSKVLADSNMLSTMMIFLVVFTTVYLIRKLAIDYASYIAIGIGSVMNIVGFAIATLLFEIKISLPYVLITTLLCTLCAIIIEFFSNVLDYERSEVLNFEDEENYYYVKVVPKIYLNTTSRKVERVYNKVDKNEYIEQNINQTEKDTSL